MKYVYLMAAAALLALPRIQAATPATVAIKDARLVTVSGGEMAKATIVLRNGLIEDVGPDVTIPAGAWVIDGAGMTVYPGFIDGLSTWGIPGAAPATAGRAAGGTTNPTPGIPQTTTAQPRSHGPEDRPQTYSFERAADLVSPADARLAAVRTAGFTTSATFPNRGIFEGLGAMIDLAGERGRDMVVAEPIGQQVIFRVGGGGGGAGGGGFPSSLMGNIAYVRQVYLDLEQYKEAQQMYKSHPGGNRRPEYDHDLEGLEESPRVLLPADEAQQIDRILKFGHELKMPFVVYGLHEAYRRIDELKQADVPVLISLKWPEPARDPDPTDIPNYRQLVMIDQAPAVPGMLAKAGVKFAFYSDGVDTAADLKRAIKKAVDAGLSRADAIRALTLSAAEIYGVSDRLGSLEKGKIANVVVTKGDIFEDRATVEYVFIDGQEFEPSKDIQAAPAGGAGAAGGTRRGTPPDASAKDGGRN